MRFPKAQDILTAGDESPSLPAPGGDDWLSRINTTITNAKELLKAYQQLRGIGEMTQPDEPVDLKEPRQPTPPLINFLQLIIAKGYGDTPIGDLFEQIKPFTIKQLIGMMGNVRPKQ